MISLDRSKLKLPPVFGSPRYQQEKSRQSLFFASRAITRTHNYSWSRTQELIRDIYPGLSELTQGKCAYCETKLDPVLRPGDGIDHFRPKSNAMDSLGETAENHYWWLSLEWTNLLPCCKDCNIAKGSRFPIQRRRAPVKSVGTRLTDERPLLIDPCVENPALHLLFDNDGKVTPRTRQGEVTIELLALNRRELVRQRRDAVTQARLVLSLARPENADSALSFLSAVTHSTLPFSAIVRQFVVAWASEDQLLTSLGSHPDVVFDGPASEIEHRRARSRLEFQVKQRLSASVESDSDRSKETYFAGARRLESIQLRHFKGITSLDLNIPPSRPGRESWLMFVGENGTGKTSILQAIALALVGEKHLGKLGVNPDRYVQRGSASSCVRVTLSHLDIPLELTADSTSSEFKVTPPTEQVLLLGYGATRLLPRKASPVETRTKRVVRVLNLFDPHAELQDPEPWLCNRDILDDHRFARVALSLKKLLMLDESDRIARDKTSVHVIAAGIRTELCAMSDGYQSVVVLAVNIMMGLMFRWESIEVAEGIVLIDEIDAHLHPRWKLQIVARLREVFPKLIFIATTHDPLCLRGLDEREIVVLTKKDGEICPRVVEEPIAYLRADQLLTSPLFGLPSTRAPEVSDQIALLSELGGQIHLSERDQSKLSELRASLNVLLSPGETPAERAFETALPDHYKHTVYPEIRARLREAANDPDLTDTARAELERLIRQPLP